MSDYVPVYYDRGSICQGGLFVDPTYGSAIEVIDLDSAAGVDGVVLLQRGSIYVDFSTPGKAKSILSVVGQEDLAKRAIRCLAVFNARYEYDYPEFARKYPTYAAILLEVYYAVNAYQGMDPATFDAYTVFVERKTKDSAYGAYTRKQAEQIAADWNATLVYTRNVEKAVLETLQNDIILD